MRRSALLIVSLVCSAAACSFDDAPVTGSLELSVEARPIAVGAVQRFTVRGVDLAASRMPALAEPTRPSAALTSAEVALEVGVDLVRLGDVSVGADGLATFELIGRGGGLVRVWIHASDGARDAFHRFDVPVLRPDGAEIHDCTGADPKDGLLVGVETECAVDATIAGVRGGSIMPGARGGISLEAAALRRVRIRAEEAGRAEIVVGDLATVPVSVVGEGEVRRLTVVGERGETLASETDLLGRVTFATLAPGERLRVRLRFETDDGRFITGALDGRFQAGPEGVIGATVDRRGIEIEAKRPGVGWIRGDAFRRWELVIVVKAKN